MIAHALLMLILSAPVSTQVVYHFDLAVMEDGYSLTNGTGAHWRWLKWGWGKNPGPLEFQFSAKGGGGAAPDIIVQDKKVGPIDVGLLRLSEDKVRLRCLAEECVVKSMRDGVVKKTVLAHDGRVEVLVPATMEIACKR